MKKITDQDPESKSLDLVTENIARLKALFPEIVTEGPSGSAINVDVLKALVGDATVTDAEEKYGLNWHGKRRARQMALTPSLGTLRPCPEESVDWDNTQNLMIEGDNLEVLKLLQKSYAGKVKLIYIDPPYNTGKDFVYPDNFKDNIQNYLELTGQTEEGKKVTTNSEVGGRFHTEWLNMMLPRLRLARQLLREDGLICISIDDSELSNLRKLVEEVFGEENFIVNVIWRKRSTPPNDKIIGANHDYIVCYARDIAKLKINLRERSEEQVARYKNSDNHPKGPWVAGDLMANVKGGRYVASLHFPIKNPKTGEEHFPGTDGNWRFSSDTIKRLLDNDEIYFGEDGKGRPKLKRFLCDVKDGVTYPSIWDFVPLNNDGSLEMTSILGNAVVFESPKPVGLLQEFIRLGTDADSLVLDFFAGSGTTGHAVMSQNASDRGQRRFILVQLPEPLLAGNLDQRVAREFCLGIKKPCNISEITKERLRRVSSQVKESEGVLVGDCGFRVMRLDTTNVREWSPDRDKVIESLVDSTEHLKTDRTEADILYEVLLKLGLDLCVPIVKRTLAGKEVHSVGGGVLIACLASRITRADVEALGLGIVAWRKELATAGETTCLFRDSAFEDDVAKTNLAAILEQNGITTVRSL